MKVYRIEYEQPDGRWTGPYSAEWMTPAAFEIRQRMNTAHLSDRHPEPNPSIFADNPGADRYVSACRSEEDLRVWFGEFFELLLEQGGHVGVYEVPVSAIAQEDTAQVIYQQRQGALIERTGRTVDPSMLIERLHLSKT